MQGTLALAVGPAHLPEPLEDDDFGPVHTSSAHLPDPQRWSRGLVQVIIEVMAGDRRASQLVRWTSPQVFDAIRSRTPPARPRRQPGHGRGNGRGDHSGRTPARVVSVRVCEPADGVAEVSAIVAGPHRARAIALRLEGADGRWVVTALEAQ
ncbi:MAG: Rv3235 family protein [Angustibacter sp.]